MQQLIHKNPPIHFGIIVVAFPIPTQIPNKQKIISKKSPDINIFLWMDEKREVEDPPIMEPKI